LTQAVKLLTSVRPVLGSNDDESTEYLSSLCAGRPLPPERFLVLIFVTGCRHQGHRSAGSITSIEKSNNLFANRTSDFSACSIVSQPTTLPRVPTYQTKKVKISLL
jgi:hypothetical protein